MNNSLYELIDRKYLKEIIYDPVKRELLIDIQEKDVTIRFFDTDHHCILMNAMMDNEQDREIYSIIKSDLLDIHRPYQDFTEMIEDKETDENLYSFFAIGIKEDKKSEEMRNDQKEYMNYLLDIASDFNKDVYQQAMQAIKENEELYIIVHGEEEKEYELFRRIHSEN